MTFEPKIDLMASPSTLLWLLKLWTHPTIPHENIPTFNQFSIVSTTLIALLKKLAAG